MSKVTHDTSPYPRLKLTLQWVAVESLKSKIIDHITENAVANKGRAQISVIILENGRRNRDLCFPS